MPLTFLPLGRNFARSLLSHNLFYGETRGTIPGQNAIIEDPLFNGVAKGDFHLSEKCPARNSEASSWIAPVQGIEGKQ